MEQEVILGCLNHIKTFKPILQIEIIKSNTRDIINILENLEYEIFQSGINILAIYKADPVINHLFKFFKPINLKIKGLWLRLFKHSIYPLNTI